MIFCNFLWFSFHLVGQQRARKKRSNPGNKAHFLSYLYTIPPQVNPIHLNPVSWMMINNDYWLDVDLISTAEEELTLTIFSWWYRRTDVLAFLHPFMSHWTAKVGHASRPSGTEGDSSQQQNYANFQIDFDAIRNRWDWWSAGGGDTK